MITAGFILCLVLCVGFGTAIPWALRADAADAHLIHAENCPECEDLS